MAVVRRSACIFSMTTLPALPATVIGSWSFPGWCAKFCEDVGRQPEQFGPEDRDEVLRDAVRLAMHDRLRAGADLVTDGEMQRVDFNLGFYESPAREKPLGGGRGPCFRGLSSPGGSAWSAKAAKAWHILLPRVCRYQYPCWTQ